MATILVAVTHLLGAGHLTRAAALARALAADGHAVTLASGGMPAPRLDLGGAALSQLPPVRVFGTAFGDLRDVDGAPAGPALLGRRREVLAGLARDLRPDAIVTELYPFGRRALADEFEALLAARGAARILASIRDVLAVPGRPDRIARTHARLAEAYDAVLVHGDPDFLPLEASWPLDPGLAGKLAYTGYVDEGAPATPLAAAAAGAVVVSGGSSAAGLPLQAAALEAARLVPERAFLVLVGRGVADADFAALADRAPPNARVERARPDFRGLIASAAVSVSQAGYNTAVDLLRARARAVLVPFEAGRETEQRLRAEAMARAGLGTVLPEAGLSGPSLAAAVRAALAEPGPAAHGIALDGAARAAAVVARLLGR